MLPGLVPIKITSKLENSSEFGLYDSTSDPHFPDENDQVTTMQVSPAVLDYHNKRIVFQHAKLCDMGILGFCIGAETLKAK